MGAAAVDPFQKMGFLQRQVEEGVLKIPQKDVPKGLALVGQEPIPERQGGATPGNAQQEHGTDGHTGVISSLLTPRPTHHLHEIQTLIVKQGD